MNVINIRYSTIMARVLFLWESMAYWSRHSQIEKIMNSYKHDQISLLEAEVLLSQVFEAAK